MKGKVVGLENVLKNLNEQIAGIENRSMAGLFEAGLKVEAGSNRKVPVQFGNLRASSYTRKGSDNRSVEIGYIAAYAVFVHENLEQKLKGEPRASGKGVYWGPAGQPKFLESTINENQSNILEIIRKRASLSE